MPRPRLISDSELLDRILEAFADLGFEGTSVRGLCRHMGISHNFIHARYQSKEAAWYAAVDHGFARLFDYLTVDQSLVQTDPLEALRMLMLQHAQMCIDHPALPRIIQQESARSGSSRYTYILEHYIIPTRVLSAALLGHLQSTGIVRDGPVEVVYLFLTTWGLGGLANASPQVAGLSEVSSQELARFAVEVIIGGLLQPRPLDEPGRALKNYS